MSSENTKSSEALQRRIDAEMLDSFDEELEMELDDERLSKLIEPPGEYQDLTPSTGTFISKSFFACSASS